MYTKLTKKTVESHSGVFIYNFEHIFLVILLLTLDR